MSALETSLTTVAYLLAGMAALSLLEAVIPLRARGSWNRAHLGPNLALTVVTFATNALFNVALVAALAGLEALDLGLLRRFELEAIPAAIVIVLALDFSTYVGHVAMHGFPVLWRFHCVHHSDPAVDVTTTARQHPGEGVIRYAFLAAFALPLGASPAAYAAYRVLSALSALLEHANVRLPAWLDRGLSLVFPWPSLHKIHHARDERFTDTNYGNLFSWWDRLFSTFTPAHVGASVGHGLDGFDAPEAQTTMALLAVPFRRPAARSAEQPLDQVLDEARPDPRAEAQRERGVARPSQGGAHAG